METKRIKMFDYQIRDIESAISNSYDEIETWVLDKYNVVTIADLNATDYDTIMNDISDYRRFIYNRNKGL